MNLTTNWPHHIGIKDEIALQFRKTLSDCINGEEWKIDMITESLDWIMQNTNTNTKMFI